MNKLTKKMLLEIEQLKEDAVNALQLLNDIDFSEIESPDA